MKKKLLLFALIEMLFMCNLRADGYLSIGYCNGEVMKNSNIEMEGSLWIDAAALITADMLNPQAGNQIIGVRAGLASRVNVDSLRVFIRRSLDGENLATGLIVSDKIDPNATQPIVRGWNDVLFDKPYTINENEPLYIGYSYKQKNITAAISYTGDPMVNSFFAKLGEGKNWGDYSDKGRLSVEAMVYGDNLIKYDLSLDRASVVIDHGANKVNIDATVTNNGIMDINGFSIKTSVNGIDIDQLTAVDGVPANQKREISYTITPIPEGMNNGSEIVLTLTDYNNDIVDEVEDNNSTVAAFTFKKNVVIEEFTTELCPNCPRVATLLHELLEQDKYKDCVMAVCHHTGYYEDWLTRNEDYAYLSLYNGDRWAPGMMFDRYPYYRNNGNASAVTSPGTLTALTNAVDDRLAAKVFAGITLTATYNDVTNTMDVVANCERSLQFGSTPNRLTLYLCEDSILPRKQEGAEWNFKHMHIKRYTNSTWGDIIDWKDNKAQMTYSFNISPEWKRKDLYLVSFIANYDSGNPANCVIENATKLKLDGVFPTSITNVNNNETIKKELFTISGMKTCENNAPKGVYILRATKGNGNVTTRKVLIK